MNVTWLDHEDLQWRDLAGAVGVLEAARVVDAPHRPAPTVTSQRGMMQHGWDGDPASYAVTRDDNGRVVAVLAVWLPHWDNTHMGWIELTVDPLWRREGIGRRLFRAGVERVRSDGRRVVMADAFEGTPGIAFLEAMGLTRAAVEEERRQDIVDLDRQRLREEYEVASRAAAAYELLRLPGSVPEALLPQVVALTAAINDAPTDDLDLEDEVFSAERIRAFEAAQEASGRRIYRLLARHSDTGDLAGHTMVAVETEQPWSAWQLDTSVLPEHRGHRLGVLLKVAMLGWLGDAEPQLRTLTTSNAASNAHMVGVNEKLGYRYVRSMVEYQRHL